MNIPPLIAGRYEIRRTLGQGAGGLCYLASDTRRDGSLVAVKVVPFEQRTGEIVETFRSEGDLLRSLRHPNLARLFDEGEADNFLYYVSEYVEGNDFVTESKTRDWNAVFVLIVQAAWALQYLHDKKVVHRDLKPANILVGKIHGAALRGGSGEDRRSPPLDDRLNLKIIDFGLAAVLDAAGPAPKTGGSLAYMAPEILQGRDYDHRADLYSFGVVLYEAALGKLPQEPGKSFAAYLERLAREEIDLSPLKTGETPMGVVKIVEQLVRKEPGRRPPRAGKIIALLNEVENERFALEPLPPSAPPKKREVPEKKKRSLASPPLLLPPVRAVARLQELTRGGKQADAWIFAEPYLRTIREWTNRQAVEDFFASAIHALVEQGSFAEAAGQLEEMNRHPVIRKAPSLEAAHLEANLAYRQGDLRAAERLLEAIPAGLLAEAPPDKRTRHECYLALVFQAKKELTKAAAHYETATRFAERSGRRDHQAGLLTNAGALYLDGGDWSRAYALFQEALAVARAIDQSALVATLTNNLGNLFLYFGRWNEAAAMLSESLRLAEEQGLNPLVASDLYLMTIAEEGKGNWEKVLAFLERSLSHAERLGDAQPILQSLLAKGYFELGRADLAACRKTIGLLTEKSGAVRDDYYLLQARWLEAKLRIASGGTDSSGIEEVLTEVRRDAEGRGSRLALWQVLADFGDLARRRDDPEGAQGRYLSALRVIDELKGRVPPEFRDSFLRDRKKEKVRNALRIETKSIQKEQGGNIMETPPQLSLQQWAGINRRLLIQRDVDPLLAEILDAAIGLLDAERGFVIYSETQQMDIRTARNFNREDIDKEEERFSSTIAREVLRKGEPLLLLDAMSDERFSAAASVHALSIRSVLCVPLRTGARPVGLIYLDNRFRQGVFREEHLPLIEILSDQASLVLEHARLHRENLEKIAELKQSKATIEKLNAGLEKNLDQTTADLAAVRESLKRQNEEISLRFAYDKIIGEGRRIKEVLQAVDRIVETDMNVYIYGESGTGKELIARAIHFNSPRKDKPFLAENCTALPETLLESELFGHVRGAFTGAEQDRIGLFEAANGGTLFLDEVGDMSPGMQSKLLRVLQEGEVRPVGGKEYRKVDVRIIAASNKDLKGLVDQGKFRKDLYYRIHVARIKLPPLRERREDIPLLIDHFLEQESAQIDAPKPAVTKKALKILSAYDWPGNIRELQNEMKRASILATEITPEVLSPHLLEGVGEGGSSSVQKGLDVAIAELEKRVIEEAMSKAGGNKVKAANLLKIGRRTLYAKLDLYRISAQKKT